MQSTINKYGEIEVIGNEVHYSIPLSYTDFNSLDELETAYKQKGMALSAFRNYLFAHDVALITNRLVFTYDLEGMKSFYYLRQLFFEDHIYYFRSFIELAKNNPNTAILWDKNNLFVDLTDGTIKALVFEFDGHRLYHLPSTLDGLKEVILLSLTTLYRILGKPRLVDFIDQREPVIRFAEQVIRATTIQEIERVLEETIVNVERKEEIRREYEKRLKGMKYFERRKEIRQAKAAHRFTAASTEFVEKPTRGLRSRNDLIQTTKKQGDPEEKQGFFSSQYFYLGSAGVAAVLLVANMFSSPNPDANASTKGTTTQVQEEGKTALTPDQIVDVYRKIMNGENQAALNVLEQAGYKNLAEAEKKQMLQLYEKGGMYEKLLQLDPNQVDAIVLKIIQNKEIGKLKELQTHFPHAVPIQFELAYMKGEYDTVIGLAKDINLKDSKLANRRKNQLLVSYLWSGLLEEATKLAGDQLEMKNKITQFTSSSQSIKQLTDQIGIAQSQNDSKQVEELKQKIEQLKATVNKI